MARHDRRQDGRRAANAARSHAIDRQWADAERCPTCGGLRHADGFEHFVGCTAERQVVRAGKGQTIAEMLDGWGL